MTTQLDSLRHYVGNHAAPHDFEGPERVLLVGSGKGGVGTSTVAALIAVMAAADGHDVLIVDADDNHGALPMLFGVEPAYSPVDLMRGRVTPGDLLLRPGYGLSLLPAGGCASGERLEPVERRSLLRRLSSLYGRYDLVVVDAGSRIDQILGAASAGAARLLAVSAAERISAAATYALVKVIDTHFAGMPVDLLFNRTRRPVATAAFDEVDNATRHFLRRGLAFAGAIPEDDRMRAAIEAGRPIQEAAALGTPATSACHELSALLIEQLLEGAPGRRGQLPEYSNSAAVDPRLSLRR